VGRGATAAIVGGTASVIGGGKFANGAATGAFVYAFNQAASTFETIKNTGVAFAKYVKENPIDAFNRGTQIVGGASQIALGGAICVGVVTCVAGAGVAALGASNIEEGFTGRDSILRGSLKAGLGETAGSLAFDGANLATSAYGLTRGVPRINAFGNRVRSFMLPRVPPQGRVPAFTQATRTGLAVEFGSATSTAAGSLSAISSDGR